MAFPEAIDGAGEVALVLEHPGHAHPQPIRPGLVLVVDLREARESLVMPAGLQIAVKLQRRVKEIFLFSQLVQQSATRMTPDKL